MLTSYQRVMQDAQATRARARWAWCQDGRHTECRVERPDGCGGWDRCECWCHLGDAFDREMDSRLAREQEREAEA